MNRSRSDLLAPDVAFANALSVGIVLGPALFSRMNACCLSRGGLISVAAPLGLVTVQVIVAVAASLAPAAYRLVVLAVGFVVSLLSALVIVARASVTAQAVSAEACVVLFLLFLFWSGTVLFSGLRRVARSVTVEGH